MKLDVRLPMGLLFLTLGIILTIYGLVSDKSVYETHSLGQNVNLTWGIIFALFGAVVFIFAKKSKSGD